MKRENKIDRTAFYNTKEGEPFSLLISHRGGMNERAENTLAAFQNALDQGCNMMETDVMVTADGVVLAIHDHTLGRLADRSDVRVSETNYADLPPMSQFIEYDAADGGYQQGADDDGQWLKLEDLFAAMPDTMLFHIDLKTDDAASADFVYEVIQAAGVSNRIIWGSNTAEIGDRCRELNPDIP